jgi:hypothetical protein
MPGPAVVAHARTKTILITLVAISGAVAGTYIQKSFQQRFQDDIGMQAKRIVDEEERAEQQALAAAESVNQQQRKS